MNDDLLGNDLLDDDLLDDEPTKKPTTKASTKKASTKKASTKKASTKKASTKTAGVKKMAERNTAKTKIRDLITKKKTDEFIINDVQKAFPESAVDSKHCTKYRKELFDEGVITAELAAFGSKPHQEWGKANLAVAKRGPHGTRWKEYDEKQKAAAKAAKEAAKAKTKAKGKK